MTWNKQSVYLVGAILVISYIYTLKSDHEMSEKIKAQTIKNCEQQKHEDCEDIERYHDLCFDKSYRSKYRVKQFFSDEYAACMKKQRLLH
jgi:hypothetical protein